MEDTKTCKEVELCLNFNVDEAPELKHIIFWEDLNDGQSPIATSGHRRGDNWYYYPDNNTFEKATGEIVAWSFPPVISPERG